MQAPVNAAKVAAVKGGKEKMKHLSVLALAAAFLSTANAGEIPEAIQNAVDNPLRTEANRERDADRKPGKVLAFFEIKPGMHIADLASGSGYFTEIMAGIVGEDGSVSAHNSASEQFDERRPALEVQYAPFGNITIDVTSRGDPLPYEDDSLDFVLLSLIMHHLHYAEESGEALPPRSTQIYADIQRVLKPGGVFGVIEHTAAPGSSREQSAAWHRAPEEMIKSDLTNAGFEFAGSADIHNNPDDDLANVWFDAGLRGKTTRFVHKYRSPE